MSTRPQLWTIVPQNPICFPRWMLWWMGGHAGFAHLLLVGRWKRGGLWLNYSITFGLVLSQDPAGWQWGQAGPLLALLVPAPGSLPLHLLAAAAAASEPGWEQPLVPAASRLPSLFPTLPRNSSLLLCSCRSAGVGDQEHAGVGRGQLELGRGVGWAMGSCCKQWRGDGLCRQSS